MTEADGEFGSRRVVITGAPGAGKSTLLVSLEARGISVEYEVARTILRQPGGMAMRAARPREFAMKMLEAEGEAYARAAMNSGPTVFDRGFPDIVGFLRVKGLQMPEAVDQACRERRYTGPVFRAPPWREIYHPDGEGIQDWEEAVESDHAVISAWRDYGYEPIDLPLVSEEERADFVMKAVGR